MHTHTNTQTRIQIRHSTHTQTYSHRHTHKHMRVHVSKHMFVLRADWNTVRRIRARECTFTHTHTYRGRESKGGRQSVRKTMREGEREREKQARTRGWECYLHAGMPACNKCMACTYGVSVWKHLRAYMQAERQITHTDSLYLDLSLAHVHDQTWTNPHTRVQTHTCKLTHTFMHAHTNTHTHTNTHKHPHADKHTPTNTHTYTNTLKCAHSNSLIITYTLFHYLLLSLSTHAHTHTKTETHAHTQTSIHTHTQTYRYVRRVCDDMCLQARGQGSEKKKHPTQGEGKPRRKVSKYFLALACVHAMRVSTAYFRVCVNACACELDTQKTDKYKQRETQTYRECVVLHACVHVRAYIACLHARFQCVFMWVNLCVCFAQIETLCGAFRSLIGLKSVFLHERETNQNDKRDWERKAAYIVHFEYHLTSWIKDSRRVSVFNIK